MKTKNRKLEASEFLKKKFAQQRQINNALSAISKLEAIWIKENCPLQVGQDIALNDHAEGYTSFLITKVHVDIDQIDGKEPKFSIQFSFTGIYRGEGLEEKTGRTRFNVMEKEAI